MSAVFFFGAPTSVARIPFLLRVWWVGGGCRNFRSSFSAFLCKYISFIVIVSISWYSFPLLSRSDIVFLPLLWYVVHGLFLSLFPLPNEFQIVSHSHKRRVHIWFELYLIFIVWYGRSNHTHKHTQTLELCILWPLVVRNITRLHPFLSSSSHKHYFSWFFVVARSFIICFFWLSRSVLLLLLAFSNKFGVYDLLLILCVRVCVSFVVFSQSANDASLIELHRTAGRRSIPIRVDERDSEKISTAINSIWWATRFHS